MEREPRSPAASILDSELAIIKTRSRCLNKSRSLIKSRSLNKSMYLNKSTPLHQNRPRSHVCELACFHSAWRMGVSRNLANRCGALSTFYAVGCWFHLAAKPCNALTYLRFYMVRQEVRLAEPRTHTRERTCFLGITRFSFFLHLGFAVGM